MTSLVLVLALTVIPVSNPPPYLQFIEEAEALGRASYLSGVCSSMGFIKAEPGAARELGEDLYRRAILAQTEGPILAQALARGIEREKAATKAMMDLGPNDGSERRKRREEQAAQYLGNGCADLTINYPEAFKWAEEAR